MVERTPLQVAVLLPNTLFQDGDEILTISSQHGRILALAPYFEHVTLISFMTLGRPAGSTPLQYQPARIIPIPVRPCSTGLALYILLARLWLPELVRVLWRNRSRWDVLVLHDLLLPNQVAYAVARAFGIPVAVLLRGDNAASIEWMHHRAMGIHRVAWNLSARWGRRLEEHLVGRVPVAADYIPPMVRRDPAAAALFRSLPSSLVRDDEIVLRPSTTVGPPWQLLSVGRVAPIKGYDLLVEAVALLRDRGLAVEATIVGPTYGAEFGGYEHELKTQCRNRGLDDVVRFVGPVNDRRQLTEYYDNAAVFVLPSRTEGTPRVVYEAMARGVPVVATDVGGLGLLFDDGRAGVLCHAGDVAGLAAAIELALAKREELAAGALELIRDLTVDRSTEALHNFIVTSVAKSR